MGFCWILLIFSEAKAGCNAPAFVAVPVVMVPPDVVVGHVVSLGGFPYWLLRRCTGFSLACVMCIYIFVYIIYKGNFHGVWEEFPYFAYIPDSCWEFEGTYFSIRYNCRYIYMYIYILYPHTWSLTHHVESTQPRFQVKMPIRSTSDMITTRWTCREKRDKIQLPDMETRQICCHVRCWFVCWFCMILHLVHI